VPLVGAMYRGVEPGTAQADALTDVAAGWFGIRA
jgi:hypothetical protein